MEDLKEGKKVLVTVYGYSGTGKTHTVFKTKGKKDDPAYDPGLVSCAFEHFLDSISLITFIVNRWQNHVDHYRPYWLGGPKRCTPK